MQLNLNIRGKILLPFRKSLASYPSTSLLLFSLCLNRLCGLLKEATIGILSSHHSLKRFSWVYLCFGSTESFDRKNFFWKLWVCSAWNLDPGLLLRLFHLLSSFSPFSLYSWFLVLLVGLFFSNWQVTHQTKSQNWTFYFLLHMWFPQIFHKKFSPFWQEKVEAASLPQSTETNHFR